MIYDDFDFSFFKFQIFIVFDCAEPLRYVEKRKKIAYNNIYNNYYHNYYANYNNYHNNYSNNLCGGPMGPGPIPKI